MLWLNLREFFIFGSRVDYRMDICRQVYFVYEDNNYIVLLQVSILKNRDCFVQYSLSSNKRAGLNKRAGQAGFFISQTKTRIVSVYHMKYCNQALFLFKKTCSFIRDLRVRQTSISADGNNFLNLCPMFLGPTLFQFTKYCSNFLET